MPAFTFEKISPPVRRGPGAPAPKKPRGVFNKVIDRFASLRSRRLSQEERSTPRRDPKKAE
jgi:hypothetical protein